MIAMKKWSLILSVSFGVFAAVPMTSALLEATMKKFRRTTTTAAAGEMLEATTTATTTSEVPAAVLDEHKNERELEMWYYCKSSSLNFATWSSCSLV
jgi:uncharacterized membrane protein